MIQEKENNYGGECLPFRLREEVWGEIKTAEEEGPGVYYIAVQREEDLLCRELYAVKPRAIPDVISEEVIRYGKDCEDVFLCEYGVEGSGWDLVKIKRCLSNTVKLRHKGGKFGYLLPLRLSEKPGIC